MGCSTVTGMNLKKAFGYLDDVLDHKQVVPFRRFAGSIGRTGQAKQFGTTKGEWLDAGAIRTHLTSIGRWPEKSVKYITRLLKNAEANADAKDLTLDELIIKNIVVEQAPKTRRRTFRAHGRMLVRGIDIWDQC